MNGKGFSLLTIYALFILNGVTSGIGDILIYRWAKTSQLSWLLAAYLVWFGSLLLLGFLFRMEHFSFGAAVLLATLIHLGMSLGWSWLFTDYQFSRLELVGLLLATLAVICLELGRTPEASK